MIPIFRSGPHGHRTPLSYPVLRPWFDTALTEVADPRAARLWIFGHILDIEALGPDMVALWRKQRPGIVLLSEEPFWDTIWGRRPLDRHIRAETRWGALPVTQINHTTSQVYAFDRMPYYLLTHPRFERAYAARFDRNAARPAADWQADFAARPRQASFLFERRPEAYHDVAWPAADLHGLCAWRTRLAETLLAETLQADAPGPQDCETLGASWIGGPTRFDLPDWHADKLDLLENRARMIGAIENTHHPDYITEKFFDAMACGAVPLYLASPGHRLHDLGLPAESWLNLWGLTPAEAAEQIRAWQPGPAFHDAFRAAQDRLAGLFTTPDLVRQERLRLRDALLAELQPLAEAAADMAEDQAESLHSRKSAPPSTAAAGANLAGPADFP